MSLTKILTRNRRDISIAAKSFWYGQGQDRFPISSSVQLAVRALEERLTPTVTVTLAGDLVTVENAGDADEEIIVEEDGGKLTVTTDNNPPTDGSGGSVAGMTWTADSAGDTDAVKTLKMSSDEATELNVQNGTKFDGLAGLRNVLYSGSKLAEEVDFSANTNDNIYMRMNTGIADGGGDVDVAVVSNKGVSILEYGDADVFSGQNLVIPDDTKIALDFSRLTENSGGVTLNLGEENAFPGGYKNYVIILRTPGNDFAPETTKFIDVITGGPGDDLLIGNDNDNLLLGGPGDDTLQGRGGNDQLNANRDFSPDVDNNPNAVDAPFDVNDDLTMFDVQKMAFNNQIGVSQTSKTLYGTFGFYGFGEGTTEFAESFETANSLNPPASSDLLSGDDGDDAMFGFNNAVVTVLGGEGRDIYSTNRKGGTALINMGEGEDTLLFATGDTAIGGGGNDLITEAAGIPTGPITFLFGGEGDDTLNGGQGPDEARPGPGMNVIDLLATNDTLIGEGGVDADGPLGNNPGNVL